MAGNSSDQPILKIGHYKLGSTIGNGAFAKVKSAEHVVIKRKVAVKIMNRKMLMSQNIVEKVKREILNHKMFTHPHIVKLYQVFSSPTDIFMIMEYVSGGELFDYITKVGRLDENEARRFFQQIICGVDYCHKLKIVHRDLKPENLLLDHNKHVKIADFGFSNMIMDGQLLSTPCGSPYYAAPEIISGNLYAGPEVDVWSCGIILYVLLCGHLPFDNDDITVLYRNIKSGIFRIPEYLRESSVASLLTMMLQVDPMKRATMEDVKKHGWFQKYLQSYLLSFELDSNVVDKNAITEVSDKFGVSEEKVFKALLNDQQNELAIAYSIVKDINKMPDDAANTDSKFEFIAPYPHTNVSQNISKGNILNRSTWHLGLRSKCEPNNIIFQLLQTMKALNYEWKLINPYHIRVRVLNKTNKRYVKLSLQLYQLNLPSYYLLDFQAMTREEVSSTAGPSLLTKSTTQIQTYNAIEFLEVCAALIHKLVE